MMIGSEPTNCGQINVKEESRKEKQFMGIKNKSELKESFRPLGVISIEIANLGNISFSTAVVMKKKNM